MAAGHEMQLFIARCSAFNVSQSTNVTSQLYNSADQDAALIFSRVTQSMQGDTDHGALALHSNGTRLNGGQQINQATELS